MSHSWETFFPLLFSYFFNPSLVQLAKYVDTNVDDDDDWWGWCSVCSTWFFFGPILTFRIFETNLYSMWSDFSVPVLTSLSRSLHCFHFFFSWLNLYLKHGHLRTNTREIHTHTHIQTFYMSIRNGAGCLF